MKNIILFFFTIIFVAYPFTAQSFSEILNRADSLYQDHLYTEAFSIYDSLYAKEGLTSPSMLLKMAYIKEGLGNESEALYYLSQYFDLTKNERALKKIEKLADERQLEGYRYTDERFFMNVIFKNMSYILLVLVFMSLVAFAWVAYNKLISSKKDNLYPGVIVLALLLSCLFYFNYNFIKPSTAIISKPYAFLMKAPSAGSDLVSVLESGHRVYVLGEKDVWVKIEWHGSKAYIKKNNLKMF